jgi:hypothetical protein
VVVVDSVDVVWGTEEVVVVVDVVLVEFSTEVVVAGTVVDEVVVVS